MASSFINRLQVFLKSLLEKGWWYYFYGALAFSFVLFYPAFKWLIAKPARYPKAYRLRHFLSRMFLILNGIRIQRRGNAFPLEKGPFIICSNHQSDIDILVLLAGLPGSYAFLGKNELAQYPLFGDFFNTLDIAVDREDPRKASGSYRKSLSRLKDGQSIVIFPEGGIKDSRKALKPFKTGAFIMASKSGTPIQPLTIQGSGNVIHPFQAKGRPGRITIYVHDIIEPGEKTAEALKDEVFNSINDPDGKDA